jgi:hypothetical protein
MDSFQMRKRHSHHRMSGQQILTARSEYMKRMIGIALTIAALAFGADVTGKWTGQMQTRGETANATFVFKNDGGKVTGTMTGPQGEVALQDMKVEGDQISFTTTGGNAKIVFKGTVAGDEIKMSRMREGGQAREFTLKREK